MLSKLLSTTAVLLAASQTVSAQTHTDCNPMEKTCPDDTALGTAAGTVDVQFDQGENDFFVAADGTTIEYGSDGAVFTIEKETQAPTIYAEKYIFFGKVEIVLKAAPGVGVVTSVVLQSDDLDEIDWEWLGGDTTQVQTNYFGKGNTSTYDRGAYHSVASPQDTFHTYTIDWTKDYVRWSIDGAQVRELLYADAVGGSQFPQTPCQLKLGTWDAGSSTAPEGTVQWAGGLTDFSQAPFKAYYKSVAVTDYSNGIEGATKYVWDEGSDGSYGSIQVVKGDGSSESSDGETTSTSSSAASSTTESSKASSSSTESSTESSSASGTASPTTLTTATTSATGSLSTPAETGTTTTNNDDTNSTETSPDASSSTPVQAGALKTGLSGALMGAGLVVAFLA
ncbi:concanavalin A-like lectin/glucanase domain-containing protein [Xylariomycetidae sp. FL2044]|nr:concanavalin A-like lectin/glucanase domain-containing protein [Xylariomycetidae sp. FL2044]